MSALNRTQHDALDEIFLNEGIHHDDGQGSHHGCSHADGVRGHGSSSGLSRGHLLGGGGSGLVLVQDLYQDGLHGFQILGRGVQISVKPAVPLHDGHKQRYGHQDRLGQRQDDLEENHQIVAAVNTHRLKQRGRHGIDVGADQNHVVYAHHVGQDEHPEVVKQSQVLEHHVVRHLTTANIRPTSFFMVFPP